MRKYLILALTVVGYVAAAPKHASHEGTVATPSASHKSSGNAPFIQDKIRSEKTKPCSDMSKSIQDKKKVDKSKQTKYSQKGAKQDMVKKSDATQPEHVHGYQHYIGVHEKPQ